MPIGYYVFHSQTSNRHRIGKHQRKTQKTEIFCVFSGVPLSDWGHSCSYKMVIGYYVFNSQTLNAHRIGKHRRKTGETEKFLCFSLSRHVYRGFLPCTLSDLDDSRVIWIPIEYYTINSQTSNRAFIGKHQRKTGKTEKFLCFFLNRLTLSSFSRFHPLRLSWNQYQWVSHPILH